MKKYEVKILLNYTSIMNLGYSHERINKGIEVDIEEDRTIKKTFIAENILDFINKLNRFKGKNCIHDDEILGITNK
jgi:4-aminobutyrate aminotransferase-like enzyme